MILFADSADHYTTAQATAKWSSQLHQAGAAGVPGIGSAYGRNGTDGWRFLTNTGFGMDNSWVRKVLPATKGRLGVALAVRGNGGANNGPLIVLLDNATRQCELRVMSDGTILVTRNGVSLGVSGPGKIDGVGGSHRHLEWWTDIANSGNSEVRVDGIAVLTLSGVDLQNTANAYCSVVQIGTNTSFAAGESVEYHVDDIIIMDALGGIHDTFIGDKRIAWFPAFAEGAQNDYVPSTGTNNAALVDENPHTDDTDFVESQVVGDIDYYTINAAIPLTATVDGIQVVTVDKKTDSGTRTVRHKIRFGAGPTVVDGAAYAPGTTYLANVTNFESSIPTPAELNAPMQFGVETVT
jgi:hypothetical protein